MKHFVAYHKVDAYGSYGISRGKIFRHFSQKSPTFLQRAVGETV